MCGRVEHARQDSIEPGLIQVGREHAATNNTPSPLLAHWTGTVDALSTQVTFTVTALIIN